MTVYTWACLGLAVPLAIVCWAMAALIALDKGARRRRGN